MVRVDKRKPGAPPTEAHNQRFHASTKPTAQQRQLNGQISAAGGNAAALAALVRENIDIMNSVNVATALHQMAKHASADAPPADEILHSRLAARTAVVMAREKTGESHEGRQVRRRRRRCRPRRTCSVLSSP